MRNTLISLLSTLILVVLALALVPFFVSTDFLKTQVEQFVKDQSDMQLDIAGDVSLSLLTGLKLSAEAVSLRDGSDNTLFATDRLDFALALAPLLSGKADITGITLNHPVITLNSESSASNGAGGVQPTNAQAQSSTTEEIDLSAVQLRSLAIRDGEVIRLNGNEDQTSIVSGLDLSLRIPDFDGPVSITGSLPFKAQDHSFSGTLANAREAINGRRTGIELDVESDLIKARLEGELAWKATPLFVANFAANAGNVTQIFSWLDMTPAPLAVGNAALSGSVILSGTQTRIPALTLQLDDQTIEAAARIFTRPDSNPLIRIAIDNSTLDLDKILPVSTDKGSRGTSAPNDSAAETTPPDLSALTDIDLTLDLRSGRISYQGKSIRQFKLLAQLIEGQLRAELKSANVAKGNIQASIAGDLTELIWNGSIGMRGLDVETLATLAGQQSPLSGTLSSDVNFAAKGLDSREIVKNGNIAGVIALDDGSITHPALEAAVANRPTSTLSNLTARVTIANLEDPIDAKGSFNWNGELVKYASTIGLGEALTGAPIPTSVSLDARPISLALTGLFTPTNTSLSGSKLSIKSNSSRALLAWLGQSVSDGTPDMPISLSTRLALAPQRTDLNDLSLQMGQSSGSGSLSYVASTKPSLNGTLAFNTLDFTPFMGNGAAQGGNANSTASSKNNANGWDTSPIDFSGLNTLNADLSLSAKSMIARDIKAGPVSMRIQLKEGQLSGSLDQLSLYGGRGTGGISVDARSNPARVGANFALAGMQMANFLNDSIALKSLAGTGGVTFDLATNGASQAQLIQQLSGSGNLEIRDGQIRGINIPQMLRSLRGNILEGWASSEAQTTDFSALTASYQINQGVVRNTDLLMLSPLVRLSGAGMVDLPNKRIDYKATPKLVSKLTGQNGLVNADGVPIPIIIKGKLDKPRIYPDIPGILENPQAVLQSLEQLGKPGKAASESIQKIEKKVTKEIQKQTEKLGIDLNKIINPNANQQPNNDPQKQDAPLEQQLLKDLTKGLFGN